MRSGYEPLAGSIRIESQLFQYSSCAFRSPHSPPHPHLGVCLTFPQAQPPRPRSPLGVPIAALSLGPERP